MLFNLQIINVGQKFKTNSLQFSKKKIVYLKDKKKKKTPEKWRNDYFRLNNAQINYDVEMYTNIFSLIFH